jgi:hypothetical protein
VNLAQDFSPGTAFRVDLVPEARLSPCFTDQFACLSRLFSHSLWRPRETVSSYSRINRRRYFLRAPNSF